MDENDIYSMNNGDNNGGKNKMPFEKKYLVAVSVIAVVLVVVMTIVGIFIGYSAGQNKVHSIVQNNPTINIEGTTNMGVGVQDVTSIVENSVVQISSEGKSQMGATLSRGSGVILTADGYIVTNAHVVANATSATSIKVALANGNEYTARECKLDSVLDIACIKIDVAEELTPAVLGDSSKLKKGEKVVVIGNPLGTLGGSVTDGVLSALDREIIVDNRPMRLLQTNAEINPGNSGGGMFNMNGELIGIVNAKSSSTEIEGIGFAIPINIAYEVACDLIQYGYVRGRIDTGIMPVNIQTGLDMIIAFDGIIGEYPAVYVYNVDARLSKDVKYGDKIVAINDVTISNLSEYNIFLQSCKVGDTVRYTLKREGKLYYVDVLLQEYKA